MKVVDERNQNRHSHRDNDVEERIALNLNLISYCSEFRTVRYSGIGTNQHKICMRFARMWQDPCRLKAEPVPGVCV